MGCFAKHCLCSYGGPQNQFLPCSFVTETLFVTELFLQIWRRNRKCFSEESACGNFVIVVIVHIRQRKTLAVKSSVAPNVYRN